MAGYVTLDKSFDLSEAFPASERCYRGSLQNVKLCDDLLGVWVISSAKKNDLDNKHQRKHPVVYQEGSHFKQCSEQK